MPITVQHQPDMRTVANAAVRAGQGQYQKWLDQFNQKERMQQRQLSFQASESEKARHDQYGKMMLQAGINAQRDARHFNQQQQMAQFGEQQRNKRAIAGMEHEKAMRDAGYDQQRNMEEMRFDNRMEAAEIEHNNRVMASHNAFHQGIQGQQTMIDYKQRAAMEAKAGELQRKRDAYDNYKQNNPVTQEQDAQVMEQFAQMEMGINIPPEDPQAVLRNQFNAEVLQMDDGSAWYKDRNGSWQTKPPQKDNTADLMDQAGKLAKMEYEAEYQNWLSMPDKTRGDAPKFSDFLEQNYRNAKIDSPMRPQDGTPQQQAPAPPATPPRELSPGAQAIYPVAAKQLAQIDMGQFMQKAPKSIQIAMSKVLEFREKYAPLIQSGQMEDQGMQAEAQEAMNEVKKYIATKYS